jgi:membrane protease YdiL (CAAX protease family)
LLAGLVAVFVVFQWSAHTLGSDRGQAGLIVGALVVAGTIGVERLLFDRSIARAASSLGLGKSRLAGLVVAAGVCLLLLVTVPLFARINGSQLHLVPDWPASLPGLFAQAGIAEEVLFRGYLYRHLREGRSFWGASTSSMLPFAAVHLFLFATMPWPIAMAAVGLAIVMSLPFACLFDLCGGSIWPPALLHFRMQTVPKILVLPADQQTPFALAWMIAGAVVPLVVLANLDRTRAIKS